MSVSCECCVLSCSGLCFGLMACREESYRVSCVLTECDRDTEQAFTHKGLSSHEKKKNAGKFIIFNACCSVHLGN
jgi:hypothetical protein